VHRVLFLADKHFRPLPKPGRSQRKPFPEWVDYEPNSIWIYDSTHFTRAQMAVLIIQDLVSRKWITEVVSAEETSTQVQVGFTDALDTEGLLEAVERRADGLVDLDADDANRPILLAVSDNGPQMTCGSTREFMAMCAIAQHFGRHGTPTDQARIENSRSKTLLLCAPNSPSPASTGMPVYVARWLARQRCIADCRHPCATDLDARCHVDQGSVTRYTEG